MSVKEVNVETSREDNVKYILQEDGAFVIEDYNHAKPFANFFPGVAGIWGIPMWLFYVNRGQCVSSFGFESKDNAILEFQPANKAYRMTPRDGFRTFLKITSTVKNEDLEDVDHTVFYEPFQRNPLNKDIVEQRMIINAHDLTLVDTNKTLGIETIVNYFTMPEEQYPGLVRRVMVKNLSDQKKTIDIVDGLPAILAYGANDWLNKHLSRTIEAWIKVRNRENRAPFYQLNVEVDDTSEVKYIKEGNFFISFDPRDESGSLLDPIVEAAAVFGQSTDFNYPEAFIGSRDFNVPQEQQTSNRTACAMSYRRCQLSAGDSSEVVSVIGHANKVDDVQTIAKQVRSRGFLIDKRFRNADIINEIRNKSLVNSGLKAFNYYAQQNFLDNVLRGGLPVTIETGEGDVAFNVFSRKHGDLERDYNFFFLSPTYYTQGNGNYRDVNQNRRNDIWLNQDLSDTSIINFFSLSQADGYNPLVVKGMQFSVKDQKAVAKIVDQSVESKDADRVKAFLNKSFMPGDLFKFVTKEEIALTVEARDFLTQILGQCQKQEVADHNEGFWSDHWHYNLDLVEAYLGLYPENLQALLLDKKEFRFFHNDAYVVPRTERYVLTDKGVRQYNSVKEAEEEIQAHNTGFQLRTKQGKGDVYTTNLLVKMLCMLANKIASLDPSGIGVEMEADKPNWYDALNGLPGLTGSSISETFEVRRFAQFLLSSFETLSLNDSDEVLLFNELTMFIDNLVSLLKEESDSFEYWKKSNDFKEVYRESVRRGIKGDETAMAMKDVRDFLAAVIDKTSRGIEAAQDSQGLFATYFSHQVTTYEELSGTKNNRVCVNPTGFERHDLPYFLEGFVHALRAETNQKRARELYNKIRQTDLYDASLGMYRVNTDLSAETEEIGRTRVFPRGWLENESIWLHMEYKYLLEILRRGLLDEYYQDLKTACVAFQNPEQYGRSILENSSFIVSSSHEDEALHGQGFVARLSGSTAEFFHALMFMSVGQQPFVTSEDGVLMLAFEPALTSEMFTTEETLIEHYRANGVAVDLTLPANTYAFNFMGRTLVVYHNPARKATFGSEAVQVQSYTLEYNDGSIKKIDQDIVGTTEAHDIRDGKVVRIDVQLA